MSDPVVDENWLRYEYGRQRGHREYCQIAKRNEQAFLGGNGILPDGSMPTEFGQWRPADFATLHAEGRPAYEMNEILGAITSAVGYQIHNRMDISFRPRGQGADQQKAAIASQVVMAIADAEHLHHTETQVFADGLIQRRGYYDLRIRFDSNMRGDVSIRDEDPLNVIPDPDANEYDPDRWADVITTRWLTMNDIECDFGYAARQEVEGRMPAQDTWNQLGDEERNTFGNMGLYDAYWGGPGVVPRVRLLSRQYHEYASVPTAFYPATGELRSLAGVDQSTFGDLERNGAKIIRQRQRIVKWRCSTRETMLMDGLSPYRHFTIIPYFPYFRRGKTRGMVDNAISPQEVSNKAWSQTIHILNSVANSGWEVEQDSLTNMTTDELKEQGSSTGLVLEYAQGRTPPKKIEANKLPEGLYRIIEAAVHALKEVTVPDAARGTQGQEVSGIAIQSKQFASQQQMAMPLDNLAHTRHMLGSRIMELVQQFYRAERIFHITKTDAAGQAITEELVINKYDPVTDSFLNDLTVGEYSTVITEVPMQVTFENGQFQQALEMRKAGVAIPDPVVVQSSNLQKKEEIAAGMSGSNSDPTLAAKANLLNAQAKATIATMAKTAVETIFAGTEAATLVAQNPAVAPAADQILRSAGFVDHDAPPIVAAAPAAAAAPVAHNTNPLTPALPAPASPLNGINEGIEGGQDGPAPLQP